jgi:hypothetical protein
MAQPGELMTRCDGDGRPADLATKVRRLEPVRPTVSFATANVRSQHGFFARLSVVHFTAHEDEE